MFWLSYYIIYTPESMRGIILAPANNLRKPEDFILLNSKRDTWYLEGYFDFIFKVFEF